MHDAERAIAGVDVVDDDAEAVDVGQLLQRDLAVVHLAPDREGLLLAAPDFRVQACLRELRLQRGDDLLDEADVLAVDVGELADDGVVGVGIAPLEGQLLELLAHGLHAHAAGQRRVDLERLLRHAPPALGLHVLERAHVVQPVRELDQQHADVGRDRNQQLAEVLGLLRLPGDEVELLDLGQTLDEVADLLAELLVDLGAGDVGVLDHVVQQRGGDGGVVELELGQDGGNFEGVGEEGIARGPLLVAVRLHGVDVGAIEQRLVGARVVLLDPLHQLVLAHHATPRAVSLAPISTLQGNTHKTTGRADGRTRIAAGTRAKWPARLSRCGRSRRRWRRARSASGFPCPSATAPR